MSEIIRNICPVCLEEKPTWAVMCMECFDKIYSYRQIYVLGPFGQAVRVR